MSKKNRKEEIPQTPDGSAVSSGKQIFFRTVLPLLAAVIACAGLAFALIPDAMEQRNVEELTADINRKLGTKLTISGVTENTVYCRTDKNLSVQLSRVIDPGTKCRKLTVSGNITEEMLPEMAKFLRTASAEMPLEVSFSGGFLSGNLNGTFTAQNKQIRGRAVYADNARTIETDLQFDTATGLLTLTGCRAATPFTGLPWSFRFRKLVLDTTKQVMPDMIREADFDFQDISELSGAPGLDTVNHGSAHYNGTTGKLSGSINGNRFELDRSGMIILTPHRTRYVFGKDVIPALRTILLPELPRKELILQELVVTAKNVQTRDLKAAETVYKIRHTAGQKYSTGITLKNLQYRIGNSLFTIPDCTITADGLHRSVPGPDAIRSIAFDNGKCEISAPVPVEITGIKFTSGKDAAKGSFQASSVSVAGLYAGKLSGSVQFKDDVISLTGKADLSGLSGTVQSRLPLTGSNAVSCTLDFPEQKLKQGGKELLHFFLPSGSPLRDGTLDGKVTVQWSPADGLRFRLADGICTLPRAEAEIKGLTLDLIRPAYPSKQSAPGQSFRFASLKAGDIEIRNGQGKYHLDSSSAFVIEQAVFDWCGGKFTVAPALNSNSYVLNCDQADLAAVLTALGLGKFAGQGKISGKLPFSITPDGVAVTGGELYSMPGAGNGVLKGILTDSVTGGDKINDRLRFACDMIQDMVYRWVRITLDSKAGAPLQLTLSFNGSPGKPVYYEPDLANGGIKKSEKPTKLGYLLLNLDEVTVRLDAVRKVTDALKTAKPK